MRLRAQGAEIRDTNAPPQLLQREANGNLHLPHAYEYLLERYAFCQIEVGNVLLFGNAESDDEFDSVVAPVRDVALASWLCAHQLVQIGNPSSGSYDPICLDCSASKSKGDAPVVRHNHEDILGARHKVRREVVSTGLCELLERPR